MRLKQRRRIAMTIIEAMGMYGIPDKDRFQCAYPDYQEKRPSSTFFADFSVADYFHENAIKDTYNRAFNEWKGNLEMLTELVAALNHKIWYWYERNDSYSKLYDSLWRQADEYLKENFTKKEEVAYWFNVLD